MKTLLLDSNVFVRFFTKDDAEQTEKAAAILQSAADGKVRLLCGPPVLFEVAWTLRSAYRIPPDRVLAALQALFGLPGLEFTDAPVVGEALTASSLTGVEFADAYIAASARAAGCDAVATFNTKDFAKLGLPLAKF
jgi:predicted nucleic acid-binding protein